MTRAPLADFATRLRMALAYADITRTDLARELGVSPQAVHKWTTGASSPRSSHLMEIVQLTGVSLDWIMRPGSPFSEEPTIDGLRRAIRSFDAERDAR